MGLWRMVRGLVREALEPPKRPPRSAKLVVTPDQTAPNARAAAHVSAARQALSHDDPDSAAWAAEEALAIDPRDLFAAFYLGQARLRQGRLVEARVAFEAAREAGDPFGLVTGWLTRVDQMQAEAQRRVEPHVAAAIELERAARAALRAGDPEQARALAAEAVATDADNLLAHHLLGRALQALGRRDEARAAFEAARSHDDGLGVVDQWLDDDDDHWPADSEDEAAGPTDEPAL